MNTDEYAQLLEDLRAGVPDDPTMARCRTATEAMKVAARELHKVRGDLVAERATNKVLSMDVKRLERESSQHQSSHVEVLRLAELLRKADPNWGSPMHLNSVLAVGEPCAGKWHTHMGCCSEGQGIWHCHCGAKRPEDCKTETAKP